MKLEFLLTSLIVILVPGTGVIYTVSAGLTQSRRAAVIAAIGCTLGIIPHLIAGVLGVSALMHAGALVFKIIRYAGVLYLAYMGIGMFRSKAQFKMADEQTTVDVKGIISKGILINLLNPKLTIFFLSFLPQFITVAGNYRLEMIWMSLQFMLMTLLVFICYGLLASGFRKIIMASDNVMAWIQRAFGMALLMFAAKLALSDD